MAFPVDDYTPHGYLNNPAHTRRLHPSGVVRSFDAGFRWHVPAFAGSYGGRREHYAAGVRLALDGVLELAALDAVTSPYHSANLVAFELQAGQARARVEYHLVGEHALRGTIRATGARRLALHAVYRRLLSASGEWGESGLVGRLTDGLLVLQGFEDGEAFALWASATPTDVGIGPAQAPVEAWAVDRAPGVPPAGFVAVLGEREHSVELSAILGFAAGPDENLEWILARGRTLDDARRHLEEARRRAVVDHSRHLAEDDAFWSMAPRLEAGWPDHWRRGFVYDLETVRMMVKEPIGIYAHPWDAMQIQAPRVVLAESAMDALVLGYADPVRAQEVLLGTFLDAPEPNVPCSREDGTFNMVAADGTVCGTAPSWGYPIWVAELLYAQEPDRRWLASIYPRLAGYLDWWLLYRRDADGYLGYACSWESGQDDSPRFGKQPLGGGHPVRHVRPVDLHAAAAQGAEILARFAGTLGRARDKTRWTSLAEDLRQRTAQLWNGGRWADYDGRAGRLTDVDDVMLAAPLALGVASADHRERAAADWLQAFTPDAQVWPMFAWTAIEAALAADRSDQAVAIAHGVVDRAYGFWDAHSADPLRALPGISSEYWPLDGRCGGEGYGWGAFGVHLVLRTLVGYRPEPGGFRLEPRLPLEWRRPGTTYEVRLTRRGRRRAIVFRPLDTDELELEVDGERRRVRWGESSSFPDAPGRARSAHER